MLLDLIYGKIGSGKTEKCIELIERTLGKNPGHNAVITVPEQYSYLTEKRIVEHFGGTGINGIEVLTFSQFFRRYLRHDNNYLLSSGKQMLLCKAALKACDADGIFSLSVNKPGFVGKLSELISEMKHYLVSPDMLRTAAAEEKGIMAEKLKATADIYEEYNNLLGESFSDSEDDFLRFADFIRNSGKFETTHIWFDGFSDFLPQHYAVIQAFAECAASVHVTVCADEKNEIYLTPMQTAKKLKKMCGDLGIRVYEQYCDEKCYTINSVEIMHLVENWNDKKAVYMPKTKDISLFCARDLYSETEHAANIILNEIKNGASYGDIGIMCAEPEKYSHLIEAIFGNLGISYFIDRDIPVTDHPIILTVLGIFDIIEENWSYESVFRYLRTGFVFTDSGKALDRDKTDKLENYVLRHGIRGKNRWFSEWESENTGVFDSIIASKKASDENLEEINAIRKTVCTPFEKFYACGKGSTRELAEALFEFLCEINLYSGINAESEKLSADGFRDAAERMKEIWNLLMETINQTVVIAGDKPCSRQSYARLLREGLSVAKMKIIPPGTDVVSIGASDRNSSARQKIMIFIGAVSGTMPAQVHSRSIFTDRERVFLENRGIENAGTSQEKTVKEEFKFFRAVSSASEKLYFSYPTANSNGEAQLPATFVKNLYKMFPGLNISDDIIDQKPKSVSNPRDAFLYIMQAVSDKAMRKNAHLLAQFFKGNEYLTHRLPMVTQASEYKKNQPRLSLESARMLYNDYHSYSVSRINEYAGCPFGYYLKYGLKVQEQQIWQIQKFDIGSLLHWAVCEYCTEVDGGAASFAETKKRWHELTDEQSLKIIEALVDDISSRVLAGLKRDREKISYLIERLKKILVRSVDIVRLSLTKGEYSAVCYEEKFSVDISWKGKAVGINGTIDRVDAAENFDSGEIALRIIDYKSGSKKFDVVAISNREDMQLAVYAVAAAELYKKGALGHAAKGLKPAVRGVLYNKLRSDLISCGESEIGNIDSIIRNNMKPEGVVIVDEGDEISAAVQMDKDIENGGTSTFLKLGVNSKGDALNKNSSSYMTSDRFRILTDYVRKTVVSLDEEIYSGKIDILPGKRKNACSYCKYKEICLYDSGTDGVKNEITKQEDAWSFMEKEVDANAEKGMDR